MKSVTIVSEDRVGLLADVSYVLGKSNVNIESLNVEVVGGKAIIILGLKDADRAAGVLSASGFMTADPKAIVIKAPTECRDEITKMLEDERITVSGFAVLTSDDSDGIYAIHVDKPRKACGMLDEFLIGRDLSIYGD